MPKGRRGWRWAGTLVLLMAPLAGGCSPEAAEARDLRADCESGSAEACADLGRRVYTGHYVIQDWIYASELYERACEGGDATGCLRLARMLVNDRLAGGGVAVDTVRAVSLFERACDGDEVVGCVHLGELHLASDSTPDGPEAGAVVHSLPLAIGLFERGCEGEAGLGCTRLGQLHAEGRGVAVDPVRAAELFDRGCAAGDPLGCAHHGRALRDGRGVQAEPARAKPLLEQGCEADEAEMIGCVWLGELLLEGAEGVEADAEGALDAFQRACRGTVRDMEGSPALGEGCFRAGQMYANGTGVERNGYVAESRFRQACRLGYEEACRR